MANNTLMLHTTIKTKTMDDELPTPQIDLFFAFFIPILCFFIIVGNLATILAFWKVPSLRDMPSELLILSLSCADLSTGLVVIPLFSPMYITPQSWPFGETTCKLLIFFEDVSVHASLFTLCAISIDRFLLVQKEYQQYIRVQSYARIWVTILVGWMFSLVTGAVEISMWEEAKKLDETAALIDYNKYCLSPVRRMNYFVLTFFLILYLVPVVLVCGVSAAFFVLLQQRLKQSWKMRAESQFLTCATKSSPSSTPSVSPNKLTASVLPLSPSPSLQRQITRQALQNLQRKRYIKPAITLLGLVTVMAVCMLPYCFYVIAVEVFWPQYINWPMLYIMLLLKFCNACIDPFIYALTQKKIKNFFKSYLKINKPLKTQI